MEAADIQEAQAVPPIQGETILVVDDEPEVARVLADMLSADGHQAETATNGAIALHKLSMRSYDLILSDIKMPELDGPGFYRELERGYPHLLRRLGFLTGDTLSPRTRQFMERAGVPGLSKPFTPEDVRRVLRRLVQRA